MIKKQKADERSDTDELQALFDSIADGSEKAGAHVIETREPERATGDDENLQALFDEVAAGFADEDGTGSGAKVPAPAHAEANTAEGDVFNRIGHMTRQVHDTLRALGCDDAVLAEAAQAIPDARQRLNYIAQMTEQAASRVLNATDIARPMQDRMQSGAATLQERWDLVFANRMSPDDFKALATETRGFLQDVTTTSEATNAQLMEIMMAQDFQDLTGQVIKKVVDLAQELETQLLQLLIEVAPDDKRAKQPEGLMNGPVIDPSRSDVVNTQEQVDDLLDSLGF